MLEKFGEISLRRTKHGVKAEIPLEMMATLSTWTGRIQRETDIPVEIDHTLMACVKVMLELREQVEQGKLNNSIPFDDLYERVKATAIWVREQLTA